MIRRALMSLLCCAAMAAGGRDVAVDDLWFEHSADGYALRAHLSAGADELIRPLLESGYVVKLKFEMRFMKNRNWLPDSELGDISWAPEIVYDSLLDRYTFNAGGAAEEYHELSAALARAGNLRAAPQQNARLREIFNTPGLYVVARYELLIDHLPQPLQVSLLTGEWEIDSGWRRFEARVRE